jgi:hypothetical protein
LNLSDRIIGRESIGQSWLDRQVINQEGEIGHRNIGIRNVFLLFTGARYESPLETVLKVGWVWVRSGSLLVSESIGPLFVANGIEDLSDFGKQ